MRNIIYFVIVILCTSMISVGCSSRGDGSNSFPTAGSDAPTTGEDSSPPGPVTGPFAQRAYFKPSAKNVVPGYIRFQFGTDVALSGNTLAVASNTTGVDVFVRKQSGWGLQTTIPLLGIGCCNVTLDGNTLVIGNPGFGDSVAIYTRQGNTWTQQQVVSLPDDGGDTGFNSVANGFGGPGTLALSGDTLAVGAPHEDSAASGMNGDESDNSLPDSGAVFVYTRSGGVWSKQAYIKSSSPGSDGIGPNSGDAFGKSVAFSGDTLVVGAPFDDTIHAVGANGDQAGAVYVFTRTNAVWSQQAHLKNLESSSGFGRMVAISGGTLVASDSNNKRVRVFTRNSGTWSFQSSVRPSNETNGGGGGFWTSSKFFAIDGDILAVGGGDVSDSTGINGSQLPGDVSGGFGTVYVFQRTGVTWSQEYYVKPADVTVDPFEEPGSDSFGMVVDVSGGAVAVGSVGEDSAATGVNGDQTDNSDRGSGAAYVFQ